MGALKLTSPDGYAGDLQPGWRITETTSPIDPASDGDGVGIISLSALRTNQSSEILLRSGELAHDRLGTISGTIDNADEGRNVVSFDLVPLGALLNAERTVPPVIGQTLQSIVEGYVASITDRITVQWDASENPTRTYPGWTANVLYMLNRLAAVNRVELVHSNGLLIVRDLGSTVLDLSDVEGLIVRRSTRQAARKTRVTRTAAVGISAVPQVRKTNYTSDPGAEPGWYSLPGQWFAGAGVGGGSITSGTTNVATAIAGYASFYMRVDIVPQYPFIGHRFGNYSGYDLTRIADGGAWATSIKMKPGQTGARRFRVELEWRDSTDTVLRTDAILADGVHSLTAGTIYTFDGTSATFGGKPATAERANLVIRFISQSGQPGELVVNDAFIVDQAMLTDVADATYFDNLTPGSSVANGASMAAPIVMATGLGTPLWDAYADGNQVISVDAGKTTRQVIQTNATWISIQQPTYTDAPPNAFLGEYIVSDSNRVPLTASEWASYGGRLEVSSGAKAGELIITLTGPPDGIPGAPGPYSVSVSDGQQDYAVLSILGVGVVTTPETVEVFTGASESDTTVEYAPDVASPFITSYDDLYEAAAWSGQINSGLTVTLEGKVPTDKLQGFGLAPGALVLYRDCRYRIRKTTIDRVGAQIEADWYVTMDDHDTAVAGLTQSDLDAIWESKRVIDYEIAPLRTSQE